SYPRIHSPPSSVDESHSGPAHWPRNHSYCSAEAPTITRCYGARHCAAPHRVCLPIWIPTARERPCSAIGTGGCQTAHRLRADLLRCELDGVATAQGAPNRFHLHCRFYDRFGPPTFETRTDL